VLLHARWRVHASHGAASGRPRRGCDRPWARHPRNSQASVRHLLRLARPRAPFACWKRTAGSVLALLAELVPLRRVQTPPTLARETECPPASGACRRYCPPAAVHAPLPELAPNPLPPEPTTP